MKLYVKLLLTLLMSLSSIFDFAIAQDSEKRFKITGFILDERNSEPLIGANVYLKNIPAGDATDDDGYFEFEVPTGVHTIVFEYIGYQVLQERITVEVDLAKRIYLNPALDETETIISTADKATDNITSTQMSMASIDAKTVSQIPVVLGETDIIRSIQLLPGIRA